MKKGITSKKRLDKRLKRSKSLRQSKRVGNAKTGQTVGLDLGDRDSKYCVLNEPGEVVERDVVVTEKQPLEVLFRQWGPSLVVMEVGTHSPWVSRLAEKMGHEVVVANARKVKLISECSRKNDQLDAEMLARLGRADRSLLSPLKHRGEETQAHLTVIRTRAQLVELRTQTINAARGLVKSFGERLPKCDADNMNREKAQALPEQIRGPIEQLLRIAEELSKEIQTCDAKIAELCEKEYREETQRLRQVNGVGPVIALSYVLTIEDAERFKHSRDVGCYLGLQPKSDQSGEKNPELRISKEGDGYLRKLLVQGAQHILSRRGPDTDLQRFGLKIAKKGKKKAKRRAVVAVARKLAILLHRLWVSGERYEPLREAARQTRPAAA